jgi:hypothetical protein
MLASRILPMSRGTTLYEGMSPADNDAKKLLGQVFDVPDTLHSTGQRVGLVLLQNHAGSAYTVPATGPIKGLAYQTGNIEDNGRKFNGAVAAQGADGMPLDDYYSTRLSSIADKDVCFGVAYGPVKMWKTTTSFTFGQALTIGDTAKLERAATGDVIWGVAGTATSAASTSCILLAAAPPRAIF